MPELATRTLAAAADVIAPDGCEVRLLAASARGSMAHFTLLPGEVARAVVHRTVEELWYFLAGTGRMWRRLGEREEITAGRGLGCRSRSRPAPGSSCATTAPSRSPPSRSPCRPGRARTKPASSRDPGSPRVG